MSFCSPRRAALLGALCALTACGRDASTSSSAPRASAATARRAPDGPNWTSNGATACERYLTPSVVAAILAHPAGRTKALSPQACTYETADNSGSLSITLTNAGPSAFDQYQQFLVDPVPLPGVGDKASRSRTGIDAVKGQDRTCTIDAVGPPGSTKLTGEALARELGAVCNALFALP